MTKFWRHPYGYRMMDQDQDCTGAMALSWKTERLSDFSSNAWYMVEASSQRVHALLDYQPSCMTHATRLLVLAGGMRIRNIAEFDLISLDTLM